MADKSNEDIGFLGFGAIIFGTTSLFFGGLISVFIGFTAVAVGFLGAKKHQIFSLAGMMIGALSLIFFNLVSLGIIQVPLSDATGKKHLVNSINATINAFEVLKIGELDDDETEKLINYFKGGLIEAEKVNIEKIDSQVHGFKLHYRNEFIGGMKLFVKGYENSDMLKRLQGGVFLDKWAIWNNENNQKLDKIKEPSLSIFYFVKRIINN